MGDLLSCPFCGETARFTEQCRDRRFAILRALEGEP
jgi:hypothetical protein